MATIQNVRAANEPQRMYQWEVEIQGLSTGSEESLIYHAQSVNLAEKSVEAIEIPYKSERSFYAGRPTDSRNVTINFWDDESHTVYRFFEDWYDGLVASPLGGSVPRTEMVADIVVRTLNTDEETVSAEWMYSYAFPITIGEVSLDYTSNEVFTFEVTFQFDKRVRQ